MAEPLSRPEVRITLAGVALALFMGSLDQTIVATALPKIARDLGGLSGYSGVVTAYLIASTAVMPIVGKLGDVYGRKPFLVGGMLWFTLASALCGAAHSMGELIAFRALQGLGAGVMMSTASTTIADLFSPAQRGKVIGLIIPLTSVSSVLGPLVGGWLTDGPGWPFIFFVNLPLGLLGAGFLARFAPPIRHQEVKDFKIDYAGVAALVASVVPLLLALNGIDQDHPWFSPPILGMAALGLGLGAVFAWVEHKAAHPILPPELFGYSIVVISQLSAALVTAGALGIAFFVPLFVQGVWGESARSSGATLLWFSFTMVAGISVTAPLVSRLGRYKAFGIVGPLVAALGGIFLARLGPLSNHTWLKLDLAVMGLGLAACAAIYNLASQNAVPLSLLGSATSMINFMRAIGASLGVALFGSILNAREPRDGLAPALGAIFTVIPCLFGLVALMALFLKEKPLRKTNRGEGTVSDEGK
ncbi:MAG TPA: MFS transporter [bacterium]|nr:MFS transporter [bacterium]